MAKSDRNGILLKSGTNEVEIAEFLLGNQSFGVNVAKIKEFVPFEEDGLTCVPNAPKSLMGMFLIRGRAVPLIDLNSHLERNEQTVSQRPVVLVTEFNNVVNGFTIDSIKRIHRLSWEEIKPLSPVLASYSPRVTGSVHIGEVEIMILDLEHIITDVFPERLEALRRAGEEVGSDTKMADKRESKRLVVAEDSNVIRKQILSSLISGGYKNIKPFENGFEAFRYINGIKASGRDVKEEVDLVITDIEMPHMDGLTLCKRIKKTLQLSSLPVVVFSSLINEQMSRKCKSVGADGQITKPEIKELAKLVDGLLYI
ncbi:MAG: chemotaxis protein [Desulfobacterales bacterium]|nr:chemotaxis protein [Desulfobacterales bacterium]